MSEPVSRTVAKLAGTFGKQETLETRAAKPGFVSVDIDYDIPPARASAKVAGTFGEPEPFQTRERRDLGGDES